LTHLPSKILASGFGSGYSPVAPGTVGSAVACLAAWGLHAFVGGQPYPYQAALVVWLLLLIFLGMASIRTLEGVWEHDAPRITADEMAGMTLTLVAVPFGWQSILAGFILFRFFDILKPFGIRSLEKVHGAWGVMLDDLLAGVFSNVVLQVLLVAGVIGDR